jgi:integrase/recombinase XerD
MNILNALNEFILALQADGRREKTIANYRWQLSESPANLIAFLTARGITEVETVTTRHLREYLVNLRSYISAYTGAPLSPESVADFLRSLHRFFSWCAEEYHIDNPMHRIEFPGRHQTARPKAATLDDVRRLLDYCSGQSDEAVRNRALVLVLIDTAARAGGICRLLPADIVIDHRYLVVNEKRGPRMVTFTALTGEALTAWHHRRASDRPTFFYHFRNGNAFTPDALRKLLARIGNRAGCTGRINPHAFRHAFACHYLLNGGDIASLSRKLGHRNIQTTMDHYIHFSHQDLAAKDEQFSPAARL